MKLIGEVHLHNRSSLIEKLGLGFNHDVSSCDSGLVLAAFDRWAEQCAEFLLGEFAFVIWDTRTRRLFCCRDQMGARQLFYFARDSGFVFSNSLLELLSSPRVPRKPNLKKLSALAFPGGAKTYPEETFHADVRLLPPASWMLVDRQRMHCRNYWQPEIRENLAPRREDEVFEALRDLLKQAVQVRLEGAKRPAALLSGGLDSSSVVSVAAQHLAKNNGRLTAFSAVISDELRPRIADEREYIDEFLGYPGVEIKYVTAPDRGPFDSIEHPARFESTFMHTSRGYLYDAMESAAVENGADVLLEGDGGEFGPTNWGRPYYAELALTGRWLALTREMMRARNGAWTSVRELGAQIRNIAQSPRPFRPSVLLQEDFVRSMACPQPEARRQFRWPCQRREQRREIRGWLARSAIRLDVTALGLRRSYPLLDKRLLEFCLAIPAKHKVRDGYSRYLVRRALAGILPPRIQWRTTKAPFSPDYFVRYTAQAPKARRFIAEIRRADPIRSIVNVDAVAQLLQRPVTAGDFSALAIVPSTVYLICFLRQFPEFRP